MILTHDAERDLWDLRIGDILFCSTRTREQAEVVAEALSDGIDKVLDRAGVAAPDCGAWDKGLQPAVETFQRALVRQALQMAEGNKSRAAALLKIGRTTFLGICKRLEKEPLELLG